MEKKTNSPIRVILFALIFAFLFYNVSAVLQTKWIYPTTRNQEKYLPEDLYALDENSLDVLVLGSSQVVGGINPVAMYDEAGLSAFNCAGSLQSIVSNYYWMMEAFKKQDPSVVVLDVSCLFEPLSAFQEQKTMDGMRFSRNKIEMAQTINELQKSETARKNEEGAAEALLTGEEFVETPVEDDFLELMFPFLTYHSRWAELKEEDFQTNFTRDMYYRGFNLIEQCYTEVNPDVIPVDNDDVNEDIREMYVFQLEYFNNIVTWCKANGKELLLIKTPKGSWHASDMVQVEKLAEGLNVPYLDFNKQELLNAIGYDARYDMKDVDHLSANGAEKLSRYLARYLKSNYTLPDRRQDPEYDLQIDRETYEKKKQDARLVFEDNTMEWLKLVKEHPEHDVFIVSMGDIRGISPELQQALNNLGTVEVLTDITSAKTCYVAAISGGELVENSEKRKWQEGKSSGVLENGTTYEVHAVNRDLQKTASVLINGAEAALNKSGINIVVYNQQYDAVLESVSIDIHNGNVMTRSAWADR